jgi:hypothetical protein
MDARDLALRPALRVGFPMGGALGNPDDVVEADRRASRRQQGGRHEHCERDNF